MKFTAFFFLAMILTIGKPCCQIEQKAAKSVTIYMKKEFKKYKSLKFGKLFEQNYSTEIEKTLGTDKKVKYSIIHYYSLGKEERKDYFHLDKDLNVVGKLDFDQMMVITWEVLKKDKAFSKTLDSLGVDTNNIKFEEKKE